MLRLNNGQVLWTWAPPQPATQACGLMLLPAPMRITDRQTYQVLLSDRVNWMLERCPNPDRAAREASEMLVDSGVLPYPAVSAEDLIEVVWSSLDLWTRLDALGLELPIRIDRDDPQATELLRETDPLAWAASLTLDDPDR